MSENPRSEYVRQPLKAWSEIIAEKDEEIRMLRGAITDALFELEESYFHRAYEVLFKSIKDKA